MRLGFALAACYASSLSAQIGAPVKDEKLWSLEGLRAGYCVRFLMSPESADDELGQDLVLLRADQDQSLHPALRQIVQAQPEFAAWVPSSLCFYYTDAVKVDGRRIAEHDARKAQMLGVWTIGAVEQGSGRRRDLVRDMYASRGRLRSAAATNLVPLQEAEAGFRAGTATSGDEYSQKLEKTRLVWNGRTAGDSTQVEDPIVESWRVPGIRRVTWSAELSLSPSSSRPLVGSLRVEGKGDLAKALKSSPIRFVGPFYRGGHGRIRFTR